jgi:hypothetical protein
MSKLNRDARDFATPRNYTRLLNSVPSKKRQEIAAEHGYDFNARKLRFDPHLRAWVLFELTGDETLRDMHAAVNGDPLYHLNGAGIDISVGGLSHAHATRPYEALQDVLMEALARIEKVPKSKRVLRELPPATLRQIADLLNQSVLFDSTTLRLPSKIKAWAEQQTDGDLPLKVHVRLHGGYGGIDRFILTAEHEHDALRYKELLDLDQAQEAGYIYLHDCGYRELDTYDDVVDSANHFVTRFHTQITVHHVRDLALPEELLLSNGYTLIRDHIVTLGAREDHEKHQYRLIHILDTKGKAIIVVTSLLDLPVEHVCLLYFYRWTIEILFRWLKHILGLAHLISHSPNGIMMQIVVTLLVYALLVLYHQGGPISLKQLLRELRYQMHARLYQLGYEQGRCDVLAEMLFTNARASVPTSTS